MECFGPSTKTLVRRQQRRAKKARMAESWNAIEFSPAGEARALLQEELSAAVAALSWNFESLMQVQAFYLEEQFDGLRRLIMSAAAAKDILAESALGGETVSAASGASASDVPAAAVDNAPAASTPCQFNASAARTFSHHGASAVGASSHDGPSAKGTTAVASAAKGCSGAPAASFPTRDGISARGAPAAAAASAACHGNAPCVPSAPAVSAAAHHHEGSPAASSASGSTVLAASASCCDNAPAADVDIAGPAARASSRDGVFETSMASVPCHGAASAGPAASVASASSHYGTLSMSGGPTALTARVSCDDNASTDEAVQMAPSGSSPVPPALSARYDDNYLYELCDAYEVDIGNMRHYLSEFTRAASSEGTATVARLCRVLNLRAAGRLDSKDIDFETFLEYANDGLLRPRTVAANEQQRTWRRPRQKP